MNTRSYALIGFLLMVSTFLLGVKYNSSVNSKESSPFPSKVNRVQIKPTMAPESPIQFGEFIHPGCSFTVLFPKPYTEENVSSIGGILHLNGQLFSWDCSGNAIAESKGKPFILSIQNKKLIGMALQNEVFFTIKHPFSNKALRFRVPKNLLPLIVRTLEFRN